MKLKQLIETMLQQEPSLGSEVKYDIGKEINDVNSAISKYKDSAYQQFKTELENKLKNKVVSGKLITDVEVSEDAGVVNVVLVTDEGKRLKLEKGVLKISNDVDGPVTNVNQRTSQPTNNLHKVKQF